jgi:RND superfamily putative drug exporter
MLESLARIIYRRRWATLGIAAAGLAVSLVILARGAELSTANIFGIESSDARALVQEVLGHSPETTFVAVFRSKDLSPTSEAFQKEMSRALDPLRQDDRILEVVTPADAPPFMVDSLQNIPGHAALAVITLKGDMKRALDAYPKVRPKLRSDLLTIQCTGHIPFRSDLDIQMEHDLFHAEAISMPLAVLVLLAVFGSLVAATLPVFMGGLAVAGGIAIVFVISRYADIAQYTVNVCSLIGLGVAIDYSLFIVSRYREELAAGHSYEEALVIAMKTTGRVVLFSGLAVGTGFSGLFFFEGSYLLPIGLGGAIVVVLAIIFALTFLPALLAVLGPKIHAGRIPIPSLMKTEGMWHSMATWVMHRPIFVLIPTIALLVFMGRPFFHLQMATADVRVLDETVEARAGYEQLRTLFPDQAATRVLVSVRFPTAPALTEERVGALFDLSRRIAKIPHVAKVQSIVDGGDPSVTRENYQKVMVHPPPEYAAIIEMGKKQLVGDQVVLMYALTDVPSDSKEAQAVIREIRKTVTVADGKFLVGGQTAADIDTTAYIKNRTTHAMGFVVGATMIILFLLLGSVVLPIKAVVMNFLSLVGSFGAIVWVFQDGHLWVTDPLPLEPSLPVLLFCVLFGLSMDYEVLMLSRIKEAYLRTGDNTLSVAEGLEKTAGLITSAAAIMVVVFSAFSTAKVVDVQAVGFGMALAIFVDATIVRVLIVPATMRLFGHLNWWAPRPLVALRRVLGFAAKENEAH